MESLADVGLAIIKRFKLLQDAESGSDDAGSKQWPKYLFLAQFDRFELWAVNLGVFVMGHGSLDYRIRDSDSMREGIHKMMQSLNRSLDEVLTYLSGDIEQEEDEDLDMDSDSESESDMDLLLDSIKDPIDRLYKMAVWIRNPSTRLPSSKARKFQQIDQETNVDLFRTYENFDYDYISSLFLAYEKNKALQENPTTSSQDTVGDGEESGLEDHVWEPIRKTLELNRAKISEGNESYLVRRIARANGLRRQQFAYWRKHKAKLQEHAVTAVEVPTRVLPATSHITQDENENLKTPLSVTTATQLPPSHEIAKEVFEKENLATFTVSEYAPSAWNPSKDVVNFPSPPKVSKAEGFFECPYCYTICPTSILSEKAWRAHIIRDLRPYICTFEHCSNSEQLYDNRDDWIEHEISTHQNVFRCPKHEEETFTTLSEYEHHNQEYHKEDTIPLNFAKSTITNGQRSCPVCSIVLTTMQKLQSHVALHLERFAMFTLPRYIDGTDGGGSEVGSASARLDSERSLHGDLATESNASEDPAELHDRQKEVLKLMKSMSYKMSALRLPASLDWGEIDRHFVEEVAKIRKSIRPFGPQTRAWAPNHTVAMILTQYGELCIASGLLGEAIETFEHLKSFQDGQFEHDVPALLQTEQNLAIALRTSEALQEVNRVVGSGTYLYSGVNKERALEIFGRTEAGMRYAETIWGPNIWNVAPHGPNQPVKKQREWSPEEDAIIIELRGSEMRWEDISKRLPGRNAVACRRHYDDLILRSAGGRLPRPKSPFLDDGDGDDNPFELNRPNSGVESGETVGSQGTSTQANYFEEDDTYIFQGKEPPENDGGLMNNEDSPPILSRPRSGATVTRHDQDDIVEIVEIEESVSGDSMKSDDPVGVVGTVEIEGSVSGNTMNPDDSDIVVVIDEIEGPYRSKSASGGSVSTDDDADDASEIVSEEPTSGTIVVEDRTKRDLDSAANEAIIAVEEPTLGSAEGEGGPKRDLHITERGVPSNTMISSSNETFGALDPPSRFPRWCRALFSFGGETKRDLAFIENDLIECLNSGDGSWWVGRIRGTVGTFPSNFVQLLPEDFQPPDPPRQTPDYIASGFKGEQTYSGLQRPPAPSVAQSSTLATGSNDNDDVAQSTSSSTISAVPPIPPLPSSQTIKRFIRNDMEVEGDTEMGEQYSTRTPSPTLSMPSSQSSQHRPSLGTWTQQEDDQLLVACREGLTWIQIRDQYFPSKTPNACRKRHERLVQQKMADDWDTPTFAKTPDYNTSKQPKIESSSGNSERESTKSIGDGLNVEEHIEMQMQKEHIDSELKVFTHMINDLNDDIERIVLKYNDQGLKLQARRLKNEISFFELQADELNSKFRSEFRDLERREKARLLLDKIRSFDYREMKRAINDIHFAWEARQPIETAYPAPRPESPISTPPSSETRPPRQKHLGLLSSYWSVSEANAFPDLLKSFGTDWPAIAEYMGTKSAAMAMNYYGRKSDSTKPEWGQFALEADAKRARGEKTPDPPIIIMDSMGKRYASLTYKSPETTLADSPEDTTSEEVHEQDS